MEKNFSKKILCIVGPTGSGKTAFSLEAVQHLSKKGMRSTIINADSRQVYKDFPIITAQPTREEMSQVPHILYNMLDIQEKMNAGFWLEKSEEIIENCFKENIIPIFVGGTGMYIKSLTEGIAQIPKIPEEISLTQIQELEKEGIEKLYERLQKVDEKYSQKIHKNDKQRITRALEVYTFTGKNISTWHAEAHQESKYSSIKIGIGMPLDELTPYLHKRTQIMLEHGALEEAEKALKICDDLNAPAWTGIGCKELGMYLNDEISLDEACELWNKNTRAYAKRQWTWFRADKSIQWCHPLDILEREKILNSLLENF